jgi:hypothetical protein
MTINKSQIQVLIVEAAAVVLAACIAFAIMWARTLPESNRAQAFLEDFMNLAVGKSTFEEARFIARKHGGIPWWVSDNSMQCTYQRCELRFVFENKPLTSTHLIPYTGLVGTITVKDGVVTERHIHYVRYARRPFAYNVRETVLPSGDTPEARGMRSLMGFRRMKVDSAGIPSAVSVGLHPSSSADEKRRAYALNVSCLSKVFGCSGPSAIFPSSIPYRGIRYETDTATW